jgi:hypothetical protein
VREAGGQVQIAGFHIDELSHPFASRPRDPDRGSNAHRIGPRQTNDHHHRRVTARSRLAVPRRSCDVGLKCPSAHCLHGFRPARASRMLAPPDGGYQREDRENRARPGKFLACWGLADRDTRWPSQSGIGAGRSS